MTAFAERAFDLNLFELTPGRFPCDVLQTDVVVAWQQNRFALYRQEKPLFSSGPKTFTKSPMKGGNKHTTVTFSRCPSFLTSAIASGTPAEMLRQDTRRIGGNIFLFMIIPPLPTTSTQTTWAHRWRFWGHFLGGSELCEGVVVSVLNDWTVCLCSLQRLRSVIWLKKKKKHSSPPAGTGQMWMEAR